MPNNKKTVIKNCQKTHYKIDPKKSKMAIRGGEGAGEGRGMSIFPSFTNILFSKSQSIYNFLNLLFQLYPIISTFYVFFLKYKTQMRRPTKQFVW